MTREDLLSLFTAAAFIGALVNRLTAEQAAESALVAGRTMFDRYESQTTRR